MNIGLRNLSISILATLLSACLDNPETFRPDVGFIENLEPSSVDDEYTVEVSSKTVFDVVSNDSDPDGDELTVTSFSQPIRGASASADSSSILFTAPTEPGLSSFEYTVSDGRGATSSATVRVTIVAANALPVAMTDTATTQQGVAILVPVLLNDSDPDGGALTVIAVDDTESGNTEVRMNQILFTPNADFFGNTSFAYTIEDAQKLQTSAYVHVNVNGRPVTNNDVYAVAISGTTRLPVLENDRDPDGEELTLVNVLGNHNGEAMIVGDQISYTAPIGFRGNETFQYIVTDPRGGTSTATVTVRVSSPPIAAQDIILAQEDIPIEINPLLNDTDPEMDTLSIASLFQPVNGVVRALSDQTVLYTPNSGFIGVDEFFYTISDGNLNVSTGTVTVTVNGRPDVVNDDVYTAVNRALNINVLSNDTDPEMDTLSVAEIQIPPSGTATIAANNIVVFSPEQNFSGIVSFAYTVEDARGGRAQATINVTVNTTPVANPDAALTQQDTSVTLDVLANDSDEDNDVLSVATTRPGVNGRVDVNPSGTVTYTPNAGFFGNDTFIYTVNDGRQGTATANVNITVNSRPTALDDSFATQQSTAVILNLLANDSDPEDTFQIESFQQVFTGTITNNGNGTLTYTPNPAYFGTENFTYTILDARGGRDSATVSVLVNGQTTAVRDQAFTQANTSVLIDVLSNDLDPENEPLSIVSFVVPLNGSVVQESNGLRYTPNNNFAGVDTFEYVITDGSSNATGTVTIRVNAAPIANNDTFIVQLDQLTRLDVLANDSDADPPNGPFADSLSIVASGLTQPAQGTVSSTAGDVVLYQPPTGFFGDVAFDYTIQDNYGGSAQASVSVSVNSPPAAVADDVLVQMEQPFTISVLANDNDLDVADSLTVSSVTQPLNGTVAISGTTDVVYTSNVGYFGPDAFTYTVTDSRGGFATANVTVNVNAPPVVVDDQFIVLQNTMRLLDVLANDTSPDLDPLTFVSVIGVSNGNIVNINNELEYTPNPGFLGTETFTYTMRDDNGGEDTGTVTLNVVQRQLYNVTTQALTGIADVSSLAVADLDADGLNDVATVNRRNDRLTILPSQAPDWGQRIEIAVGDTPIDVIAGDLNQDGLDDLAVANQGDGTVTILLNTSPAPGVFTFSASTITVGGQPQSVRVVDANQDANLDIVIATGSGNEVVVAPNTTAAQAAVPTFATLVRVNVPNATDLAVIDVNQDNVPDIVSLDPVGNQVVIALNQGGGAPGQSPVYNAPTNLALSASPYFLEMGDLNRDNVPDLVVGSQAADSIEVRFNTTGVGGTTPSFSAATELSASVSVADPSDAIITDINQDTVPDIAFLNQETNEFVSLLNTTVAAAVTPTFGTPVTVTTDSGPVRLAEIFIDNDFSPDYAVLNSNTDLLTSYLNQTVQGDTNIAYNASTSGRMGRSRPVDVHVDDLTRDGVQDTVTLDQVDRSVSVFATTSGPGISPVTLRARQVVEFSTPSASTMDIADINSDNLPDLLVLDPTQGQFFLRLNATTAPGTAAVFGPEQTVTSAVNGVAVAVSDLDIDGVPDIIVVEQASNRIAVHRNATAVAGNTVSFVAPQYFATGLNPTAVAADDLNQDGRVDIIVTNGNQNSVSVFINQTTTPGPLAYQTIGPFNVSILPTAVAVGDIDDDGILDIITANQTDDSIAVIRGTTLSPTAPVTFDFVQVLNVVPVASTITKLSLSDLNSDGRLDIVAATDSNDSVSVFYNLTLTGETNIAFGLASYNAGELPVSAAAADLNQDTIPEIVVANSESDDVVILHGQ